MTESSQITMQTPAIPILQAWQMLLEQLYAQIDRTAFTDYVRDTRVIDLSGDALTIAAPSPYARDWINSRLSSMINRQMAPLLGQPVKVRAIFQEGESAPNASPRVETAPKSALEKNDHFRVVEQNGAIEPSESSKKQRKSPTKATQPAGQGAGQPLAAQVADSANVASEAIEPVTADHRTAAGDLNGPAADGSLDSDSTQPGRGPARPKDQPQTEAGEADDDCTTLIIEEIADTIEAALTQPGRIVAFPRYELRHIPLVGPEAFFLRLAFLQERFLNTPGDGRSVPFETTVEALLRWANVGRATLHRFKKGDPARGQLPAAPWFGIEQLPSAPRRADSQQQPPCRYRLQQGIPLTPMDADHLAGLLAEAGVQVDPLGAIQALCARPQHELLAYPPPAPSAEQKRRAPAFITVASVVQSALAGMKLEPGLRARIQEATNQLADLITTPQQLVFVSWYFLRHWLPLLGHDAAALVLYTRAQGYYNPQDQELRDEIHIAGGYRQLAQVIGLRRDRTIGDWLPNLFDRQETPNPSNESEKWQAEQQRQRQMQDRIGAFLQVLPGSRKKMPAGHYAFSLRVQIQGEPLTPQDQALRAWVNHTLAACQAENVLDHFYAWVTAPVIEQLAGLVEDQNDGAGTLGHSLHADSPDAAPLPTDQNDGWGILAVRDQQAKMTARESAHLDNDGWGILEALLNDGMGILARFEMTARELFKGLLRLNTFWETIRLKTTNTSQPAGAPADTLAKADATAPASRVVVDTWDLREICQHNGGINPFREAVLTHETSAEPFLSWLLYAYSFKGQGINDPVGWALTCLQKQPGRAAEGVFNHLAALPPEGLMHLLRAHLESGMPPMDEHWRLAFRDAPLPRLRQLADTLGLAE